MKKIKFYSFASALLLAAAAGMSSCSSDATEGAGGETTGSRDVVKTQFAINIPYAGDNGSTGTRMTDEYTQNQKTGPNSSYNNFRGIENMILLAFKDEPSTERGDGKQSTADKVINIGSGNNAYDKGYYTSLYRDIEIPTGTQWFIMNGRAMRKKQGAADESSNFEIGKITAPSDYSSIAELSKLIFSLTPINNSTISEDNVAKEITKQLNTVAEASVTYKVNSQNNDTETKTMKWSELSTDTWSTDGNLPAWMTPAERDFLIERYKRFTNLSAGSKASVVSTLQNLKEVLVGTSASTDGTSVDGTKQLTAEIYKKCNDALKALNDLALFPRNLSLPDGVAKLSFASGVFSYEEPTAVTIGSGNNINYKKICYPAEISYFVKTKAMVSPSEVTAVGNLPSYADWLAKPTDTNTWSAKGFTESPVATSTKSVALQSPIQYSVACLKTSVVCSSKTLEDNKKGILDPSSQNKDIKNDNITIPDDGFKVRAILVGGQPNSVNWDFYAKTDDGFDCTIYDKDMNGDNDESGKYIYAKAEENASTCNYTLVLDNKKTSTDNNKKVYVTIELENGPTSFYGFDGLVPANGRFYLVGELDPDETADGKVTGKTGSVDHVFVQDHTTTAKFKITSLKKAYNCIPDLRTAGVNVGLAVDLEWQDGITFNVDL